MFDIGSEAKLILVRDTIKYVRELELGAVQAVTGFNGVKIPLDSFMWFKLQKGIRHEGK